VRDLSEQEFRSLVDAGSAQGQVDASERRLIHRVFEFSDKNVGQVMTPRDRIFGLSYDLPMQRLVKELAQRGFSRVPIYQKSLDNIRGVVNAKDLVRSASGQPITRPLGELLHEPLFVPRTTPVKRLFLTFKQKKVHMAIVVSEYGKVLGLVTMDDLLAVIFGVLRDERADLQASVQPGVRQRARTPERGVAAVETTPKPDGGDAVPNARPPSVSEPVDVLDPPAIRPVHFDEVTPPAIEIDELQRMRERKQ
jgi:CBS domain containing-hemolysin-like protein